MLIAIDILVIFTIGRELKLWRGDYYRIIENIQVFRDSHYETKTALLILLDIGNLEE